VTRFGRFVRTCNPGPHAKFPFGIEQVQKVPVQRQLKQEFGFRTARADIQSSFHKDEKTQAESGDADRGSQRGQRSNGSSSTRSPTRTSTFSACATPKRLSV